MKFGNIKTILLFLGLCILCQCSKQKLRLPVEEIKRPLSLPPKNWNVGLGLGPRYYTENDSGDYYSDGQIDFTYPYLPLSEKAELHFTLLNLKYYLIRNTEIIDSTIVCTGLNWALGGGMTGISFSSDYGTSASFDLFTEFKLPISGKAWTFSNCWMQYTPIAGMEIDQEKHRLDLSGEIGFGYQWNRKLYSTINISGQYQRFQYSSTLEGPYWISTFSDTLSISAINLYSYTGYNINKRWKLYARPAVSYNSDGSVAGSAILGFIYYW